MGDSGNGGSGNKAGKPVETLLGQSCYEVIGDGHLCAGCPTEKVFRTSKMDTQLHRWADAEGEERERLWNKAVGLYSGYEKYRKRAGGRKIPVVVLNPMSKPEIV